ncbi:TlpA disulfide reductase family protein [Pedobacter sp. SYP-B3415]|uniref:TlpA family protein disulfide reductase n=1 Tax=Pedobacter sp. SYP-B3415 TaxID=2496641 RepID=UPI00101CD060|nr:TlpA disulfide reductase family protein [Pedobacter sp. SYP-B3415]
MKSSLIALFIFASFQGLSQVHDMGNVVVKGTIPAFKNKIWSFSKTTFFDSETEKVELNSAGDFAANVNIQGEQNLMFSLADETFTIHVTPGDTVLVSTHTSKQNEGRLHLTSPNPNLNRDLQFYMNSVRSLRKLDLEIFSKSIKSSQGNFVDLFNLINLSYNKKMKILLDANFTDEEKVKLGTAIYFDYTALLIRNGMYPKFNLGSDSLTLSQIGLSQPQILFLNKNFVNAGLPETLNTKLFYQIPEYRTYLLLAGRQSRPFNHTKIIKEKSSIYQNGQEIEIRPAYTKTKFYSEGNNLLDMPRIWMDYYYGLINFDLVPIRDWFITYNLILAYQYGSNEVAGEVNKEFLKICQTKVYRDTLTAFTTGYLKYRPGHQAPAIDLTDINGKMFNLSQVRGKLVYIDFWGASCAPCINEIRESSHALHSKYAAKDIVFINICVDSSPSVWKQNVEKYKLKGINLLAEGWTNSIVCESYKVDALPHYVLLDRNGNFIQYRSQRPSELLKTSPNVIDLALSEASFNAN